MAHTSSSATEQLNVRLPKELVQDLATISSILQIQKAEWIKQQLAEAAREAKLKLLEDASRLHQAGALSESEFNEFTKRLKSTMLGASRALAEQKERPGGRK